MADLVRQNSSKVIGRLTQSYFMTAISIMVQFSMARSIEPTFAAIAHSLRRSQCTAEQKRRRAELFASQQRTTEAHVALYTVNSTRLIESAATMNFLACCLKQRVPGRDTSTITTIAKPAMSADKWEMAYSACIEFLVVRAPNLPSTVVPVSFKSKSERRGF